MEQNDYFYCNGRWMRFAPGHFVPHGTYWTYEYDDEVSKPSFITNSLNVLQCASNVGNSTNCI